MPTQFGLKEVVGLLCVILQYAIILIGLSHQIVLIRRRKSSRDVSVLYFTLCTVGSIAWFAYALFASDLFILLPQILGIVGGAVLLWHIHHYRAKSKSD